MAESLDEIPRTEIIEFDATHFAKAVIVASNESLPEDILSLLDLGTLPKGVISISGGAKDFPTEIVDQTRALVESVIVPLACQHNLMVVDGGTEAGIMKIIGEAFDMGKSLSPIVIGDEGDLQINKYPDCHGATLVGFVPENKIRYPGMKRSSSDDLIGLDHNHSYFVVIADAKDWGEEVESMFAFLDYLNLQQGIPIINVIFNGGRVTIKEVFHATQQNRPIIVLEGSTRAVEAITATLDGEPEEYISELLLDEARRIAKIDEIAETMYWLNAIAKYENIVRLEFPTSPNYFEETIRSKLVLPR